jgi:hypothetical protein
VRYQTLSDQRRGPVEVILARNTSDPGFRQSLKDDPSTALGGLAVDPSVISSAEVFGYLCRQTCGYLTCRISCVTK